MEVVPLHKHKQYTNACAEVLNKQWPRSMGARLHAFSKSCDTLPTSLAFVHHEDVIGFSKLSAVQGKTNSCLLESVVVREADRGKGFGRILMTLTEKYAQGIGIETIYLTTIDKEGFYTHLGYGRCKPVLSLGDNAHRVPDSMLQHLMADLDCDYSSSETSVQSKDDLPVNEDHSTNNTNTAQMNTPVIRNENCVTLELDAQSKVIHPSLPTSVPSTTTTVFPALPPPPPPPPPPMALSSSTHPKTGNTSFSNRDPNYVTWMKKDLC